MNKLDYNYVGPNDEPHDATTFRIQASGIAGFFSYTNSWYREKLLGEPGFIGSTASVLGTSIHWTIENYIKDGTLTPENKQEMYDYIMLEAEKNPDLINEQLIRRDLTPMWSNFKNYITNNPGGLVEPKVVLATDYHGITVGGSIDCLKPVDDETVYTDIEQLRGMTVDIIDWKTTSSMSIPKRMSKDYEWQLLVYAYVIKTKYDITTRNIINMYITRPAIGRVSPTTGKPMKDYPAIYGELIKPVTSESLDFIKSLIDVVAHSTYRFITTPADRYLLAQDMRLVGDTTVLPFTSIGQPANNEDI